MAQPTPYDRQASFSNIQAQAPDDPLPGDTLDAELNAIKATLDEVLNNVALIQRDDGELANESVGLDQLAAEIEVGWNAPEVWVTATEYADGSDTVFHGSGFYRCTEDHTSGVFATDLAAGKWELIVDLSAVPLVDASQIANTPAGSIAATTVQAAIDELAAEKAATSHTHTSSAISDSTAAGRALLTAANVAAQQAILGLDALEISNLPVELALTGILEPAALGSDQNDWAPIGIATASTIRMSSSLAVNITGIVAPAVDGTVLVLENVGTLYNITLLPSNAASVAVNRFLIPRPIIVRPNQSVALKYDLDSSVPRWRLLSTIVSSPVVSGFKGLYCGNASGNGFTFAGTANTDFKIQAEALTLEDSNGESWRATSVSVTAATGTTGANGFDGTGSLVSAPLFAWVIGNPTTNTIAALLSRSATAPTMPSGYTFKARVGGTFTNSSSQLLRTFQAGRRAQYVIGASVTTAYPSIAVGSNSSTMTSTSVAALVPSTASVIHASLVGTTSANTTLAPNATNSFFTTAVTIAGIQNSSGNAIIMPVSFMLESMSIWYGGSAAGSAAYMTGWEDNI